MVKNTTVMVLLIKHIIIYLSCIICQTPLINSFSYSFYPHSEVMIFIILIPTDMILRLKEIKWEEQENY